MNAADVSKYGHGTVLQALEGLPPEAWETGGVCGVWSVKDIVAHLASYEQLLVEVLATLLEPGPTPYRDEFVAPGGGFNDRQVALRAAHGAEEVLAEYRDANARVAGLLARLPAETLREPGTLPWYGGEYALDDFLVYMYYGHKREHCAQIAVYRDRLTP